MDIRLGIAICGIILAGGPALITTVNKYTAVFSKWPSEKKFFWGSVGLAIELFTVIIFGILLFFHFTSLLCNVC